MSEDFAARAVLVVVMAGMGLLLLVVARATAEGRLARNGFIGIRTPATTASDAAWLAGHRAAERPTRWAGRAAVVSSVPALLPVPMSVGIASALAGCCVVLVLAVRAAVVAGRGGPGHEPARRR